MKKLIVSVCIVLLCTVQVSLAIFVVGDSDNTNAPPTDGGCGYYSQGTFGSNTATVIGTNYIVTSSHVYGVVGQMFSFRGSNYVTVSYTNSPSGRLRVWKITGKFPTNSWAKCFTNSTEIGKQFFAFGSGPKKGNTITTTIITAPTTSPSCPLQISNLTVTDSVSTLDVTGGDVGNKFVIETSTDLVNWAYSSNCTVYTVPTNRCLANLAVTHGSEQRMFYRTRVVDVRIITNGWERTSIGIGIIRWGINFFGGIDDGMLWSTFDLNGSGGTNECASWNYDSSGGCFIKDTDGQWKLAGLIESTSSGDPYLTATGNLVYGAMCDLRGLTSCYFDGSGQVVPGITFPTTWPEPLPTQTYYTRISSEWSWLKQFAGK